jgi:hypothetical protein
MHCNTNSFANGARYPPPLSKVGKDCLYGPARVRRDLLYLRPKQRNLLPRPALPLQQILYNVLSTLYKKILDKRTTFLYDNNRDARKFIQLYWPEKPFVTVNAVVVYQHFFPVGVQ